MSRTGRLGTLLWLAGAAVILLWPVPVDRGADRSLFAVLRFLHEHGVPRWLGYSTVEFSANVLLFAPLGAFLVLLLIRRIGAWSVLTAIAGGLAVSLAAELAQALFLPDRFHSVADVTANTLGTALAAIVTGVWVAARGRSPAGRRW